MSDAPLLDVEGLEKHYPITEGVLKKRVGTVRAVDGIDFDVHAGETVGIVGESGCGKSTAATSLLRLEEPTGGEIRFRGENIRDYDASELKAFRRHAQMVFQDPSSSFDPRMSIGESIAEPLLVHGMRDRDRRRAIVRDLLERVGLSADDIDRYPHEFSGGQKQRVAIARALSVNPDVIVADEPVSALDVSVQAEILNLVRDVQDEFDLAIVFISHNMGVIREICDRVNVMYLGEIVESGPAEDVFENPQHPYTQALLSSILEPDPTRRGNTVKLSGDVPSPSNPPSGCRFHTRCPQVIQPEGYDFEQAAWRAVMDFRVQLRTGIDLEAVREFVGVDPDAGDADLPSEEMTEAIRDEFDLPDSLGDAAADDVLASALDDVVHGDQDAARDRLAKEFYTPCEESAPAFRETDAGHPASCLRHERDRVEPPARVN